MCLARVKAYQCDSRTASRTGHEFPFGNVLPVVFQTKVLSREGLMTEGPPDVAVDGGRDRQSSLNINTMFTDIYDLATFSITGLKNRRKGP